jgi:hypothetical protein
MALVHRPVVAEEFEAGERFVIKGFLAAKDNLSHWQRQAGE